jgi:5'-nucleotidase
MTRPLVLLSNDDGYRAQGLETLAECLAAEADVVVCAPQHEQSAASHALSLHRPLRLGQSADRVYYVDGTPADSVYVALYSGTRILPRRPDLVLSGINHGVNLGDDVFYSGTVAAAREAALRGIPAMALSAAHGADLGAAARCSTRLALALLAATAAPQAAGERAGVGILMNVNFPPGASWPLRPTRLGARVYAVGVEYRHDPRGREYLWIAPPGVEHPPIPGSDTEAFDAGAVGVTPLVLDLWAAARSRVAEAVVAEVDAPAPGEAW